MHRAGQLLSPKSRFIQFQIVWFKDTAGLRVVVQVLDVYQTSEIYLKRPLEMFLSSLFLCVFSYLVPEFSPVILQFEGKD